MSEIELFNLEETAPEPDNGLSRVTSGLGVPMKMLCDENGFFSPDPALDPTIAAGIIEAADLFDSGDEVSATAYFEELRARLLGEFTATEVNHWSKRNKLAKKRLPVTQGEFGSVYTRKSKPVLRGIGRYSNK